MNEPVPAPDAGGPDSGAGGPHSGAASPPGGASTPEPARRVSAATPLLNAWKVATALVAFAVWQGRDIVMEEDLPLAMVGLVFLGILIVASIISLAYNFLAWRRLSYGFDAESIYLHHGILFRSQRHVRLDRIQSVDLHQPVLARIFGFARLQVTSAGSGQDNLIIAFVSDNEARRLRNEILARAAGLSPEDDAAPHAPEAPERVLFELAAPRLFGSLLRSLGLIVGMTITVGFVVAAIVSGRWAVIAPLIVPIIAQVGFWWQRINGQFAFRVATSPDGIRLRYGLLDTTSRTVPPGRIQAVGLTQPVLWRRKNWWRVSVTVAGEAGSAEQGEPILYPVATQEEVAELLYLILPDLATPDPLGLIDAALTGTGPARGFTTSPRRARLLDPLTFRRTGYAATDTAAFLRRGRLIRSAIVVPTARIQSIGADQGPLERRLGIANVALHTTPGAISPSVPHLQTGDARAFVAEFSARARAARRSAGPERWMEKKAAQAEEEAKPCPN